MAHFPERWPAGAACSHLHTRTPSSSKTATYCSPRSAGSGYLSILCANTWKETETQGRLEIQTPKSLSLRTRKHAHRTRNLPTVKAQRGAPLWAPTVSLAQFGRLQASHWITIWRHVRWNFVNTGYGRDFLSLKFTSIISCQILCVPHCGHKAMHRASLGF